MYATIILMLYHKNNHLTVKWLHFRFYELDVTQSLQENFKSKTIIEYPIIYVIQKDHSDMFEVIESGKKSISSQL